MKKSTITKESLLSSHGLSFINAYTYIAKLCFQKAVKKNCVKLHNKHVDASKKVKALTAKIPNLVLLMY